MFIYHLYILFGEIAVHIFCSFLIAYFWFCCCCCCCCFWQLSFENSLYSTDLGPSLDVWFANIVSYSVAFPLMLCKGFLKKRFFILMRFSLSSVPFMEHVFGIKSMNSACVCSVVQLCPTHCDLLDGSPPGSSVHGVLQAKILEWVPYPTLLLSHFSRV